MERHLNQIFRAEILERKIKWETTQKARKKKNKRGGHSGKDLSVKISNRETSRKGPGYLR